MQAILSVIVHWIIIMSPVITLFVVFVESVKHPGSNISLFKAYHTHELPIKIVYQKNEFCFVLEQQCHAVVYQAWIMQSGTSQWHQIVYF